MARLLPCLCLVAPLLKGEEEISIRKRPLSLLLPLLLLLPAGCRVYKASPEVAFLGDSITAGWAYPRANFGVSGNTTAQMLERFPAIIPGKGYRQVVILGGTNDVLLGIDPRLTVRNLEEIAARTLQAGAEPVLCEIPPVFHSYVLSDKTDYSPRVLALNRSIAALAAEHKWKLVDYYDAMRGHSSFSSDGVHMKRRGYAVMEWTYLREAPAP